MKKPKYEKPLTTDLSSIQAASGSCVSGSGELPLSTTCQDGALAYFPCTQGTDVLGAYPCTPGSSAGQGCFNGSHAG